MICQKYEDKVTENQMNGRFNKIKANKLIYMEDKGKGHICLWASTEVLVLKQSEGESNEKYLKAK